MIVSTATGSNPATTLHQLVRERGADLTLGDLEAFAARREKASDRQGVLTALALLAFVALLVACAALQPADGVDDPMMLAVSAGAGVLSLAAFTALSVFMIMAMYETSELDQVRYAIARLADQQKILDEALKLAAGKRGYALFLRSFDVEGRGSSQEEIEQTNASNAEMEHAYSSMSASMGGGHVSLPAEVYVGANNWTAQNAALLTLGERLPVVLLENIMLSSSKRTEIEVVGAIVVPVVLGDWWEAFLGLFERARAIVFFIDVVSPALRREMHHVIASRRSYIVISSASAVAAADPLLDTLLRGARRVVTYDLSSGSALDLPKALTDVEFT